MVEKANIHNRWFQFFCFTLAAILFIAMFNHGPIPSMEPRYAEVVQEMIAQEDYLIPLKNGVPYLQYPPLNFWLGAAGKLLGLPIAAAVRLPCYLAFGIFIFWLVRLQRRLIPELDKTLLPMLCVALPNVFYAFFIAQADPILILGVLIAFSGFVAFRQQPNSAKFPWELWSGVSLAVAAKGPVGGFITLPAMFLEMALAYFYLNRDDKTIGLRRWFAEFWRMAWLRGLGLILLVNAPWYIAVGIYRGWDLVNVLVVYQNFTRFIAGFGWHVKPWYYYSGSLIVDLFPISLLLPFTLYLAKKKLNDAAFRVAFIWFFWTLFFFTLSSSKQGKYLMPAAPAFAVLAIITINEFWRHKAPVIFLWLKRWATAALVAVGIAVVAVLPLKNGELGAHDFLQQVKRTVAEKPGRIFVYLWPRANMLFELGSPLNYVRSSRELYARIAKGEIAAGDYLLVEPHDIKPDNHQQGDQLNPAPGPLFFEQVAAGKYHLYRVTAQASLQPIPPTPEPLPTQWYNKFDID
jgi:4-amino-4-deoxy-L-arabinose transferase-like glycosyltransferase